MASHYYPLMKGVHKMAMINTIESIVIRSKSKTLDGIIKTVTKKVLKEINKIYQNNNIVEVDDESDFARRIYMVIENDQKERKYITIRTWGYYDQNDSTRVETTVYIYDSDNLE